MAEVRKGDVPAPRTIETWPTVLVLPVAVVIYVLAGDTAVLWFMAGAFAGAAVAALCVVLYERKVARKKQALIRMRYRDRESVRRGIAGPGTAPLLRDIRDDEGAGR